MTPWRQLILLASVELLAMSLWFSMAAVVPQLTVSWRLSSGAAAWLTMSVQLGFVAGALASAVLNLPDRFPLHRLIAAGAVLAAVCNAAIALGVSDAAGTSTPGWIAVVLLRVLTGAGLACVYPPGMKLIASWFKTGRGLAIGIMVAALTVGSASPHLFNAFFARSWTGHEVPWGPASWGQLAAWRVVLLLASGAALLAAVLAACCVRAGAQLPGAAPFDWRYCLRAWRDVAVRRANFGYLGHMWELYAMWAWAPWLVLESYRAAGWSETWGRVAGFCMVASGAIGCVVAGRWADRFGRTRVAMASLWVSGGCALVAGFLVGSPHWLTLVCLIWGISVVADSAQFSAAVSELCEPRYVGTALTMQTCVGFLLTVATIRGVAWLQPRLGWGPSLAVLALGPAFGIYHTWRLGRMDEAKKMASGNR